MNWLTISLHIISALESSINLSRGDVRIVSLRLWLFSRSPTCVTRLPVHVACLLARRHPKKIRIRFKLICVECDTLSLFHPQNADDAASILSFRCEQHKPTYFLENKIWFSSSAVCYAKEQTKLTLNLFLGFDNSCSPPMFEKLFEWTTILISLSNITIQSVWSTPE